MANYCPECGTKFEKEDKFKCPECGEPFGSRKSKSGIAVFIVLILIIGGGFLMYYKKATGTFPGSEVTLYDKQIQIQEDHYYSFTIKMDEPRQVAVEYQVVKGPTVDIYFVDSKNYYRFKDHDDLKYFSDLSTFGLNNAEKQAKLSSGDYYLIVDNTDRGPTMPPMNMYNDVATVNMEITKK